jgi:hypothetical protein
MGELEQLVRIVNNHHKRTDTWLIYKTVYDKVVPIETTSSL